MKPITDKQINAIEKLARVTKTEINNIEGLSSVEASKVITELAEKFQRKHNAQRNVSQNDFVSGALAGLAIKTVSQRCKVEEIIGNEEQFKKRVVELYQVFSEARQKCLA